MIYLLQISLMLILTDSDSMGREWFGYSSVRGLLHQHKNLVNQDAYIVKCYKFGTVFVVSDGLGSYKHSDIGSQAACKAVCDAVQKWEQYKDKDFRLLIPLVHTFWNLEIFPYPQKECKTTCLFVYISKEGRLYAAQLGDGNIYIAIDDELELLHAKEDEFSNFTSGLGSIACFDEWTLKEYDIKEKSVSLMLMTDGVSETLIEGKKEEFVRKIWKKMSEIDTFSKINNMIYSILHNWNKINAGDDRTIVCYRKK